MMKQIYFPLTDTSFAEIRLEKHGSEVIYGGTIYEAHMHDYDEARTWAEEEILENMQTDPHNMFDTLYDDSVSNIMDRMIESYLKDPIDSPLDIPDFAGDAIVYDQDNEVSYVVETGATGQIKDELNDELQKGTKLSPDDAELVQTILRDWAKFHLADVTDDRFSQLTKPFNQYNKNHPTIKPEELSATIVKNCEETA